MIALCANHDVARIKFNAGSIEAVSLKYAITVHIEQNGVISFERRFIAA